MATKLYSPHPFRERILMFGGGGAGKTEAVLSIAQRVSGTMYVLDTDYSAAYTRALATTYGHVGNVEVVELAEANWEDFIEALEGMVKRADADEDWVVVDSITPTWQWVQNWFQQTVHGEDLAAHLIALKREHANDAKAYNRAVLEDMNWPLVKKEYQRLYRVIQQWKGHLVLTAEAKQLGRDEKDSEKMLFGHLGFKPSGEGSLHHMASTNLFLSHPKRSQWVMNTVKDRNREEMENVEVKDFAMNYLRGVAGWKVRKKATKVEEEVEATDGDGDE